MCDLRLWQKLTFWNLYFSVFVVVNHVFNFLLSHDVLQWILDPFKRMIFRVKKMNVQLGKWFLLNWVIILALLNWLCGLRALSFPQCFDFFTLKFDLIDKVQKKFLHILLSPWQFIILFVCFKKALYVDWLILLFFHQHNEDFSEFLEQLFVWFRLKNDFSQRTNVKKHLKTRIHITCVSKVNNSRLRRVGILFPCDNDWK